MLQNILENSAGLAVSLTDSAATDYSRTAGPASVANGTPQVSVIMPAYNVARYIGEALASVFAQTYQNYEVIVVNDGSPDTPELEQALIPYAERIVYLKQENRGVSAARNTALQAARSEFVAFLDPDDLWEPDYLARQTAALENDLTLDVIYPNALIFGEARWQGCTYMDVFPSRGAVTIESICRGRCRVTVFAMARRASLVRAGLFDEKLTCGEDYDLWLRVLKHGGRIAYQRQVLARYRRHAGQATADSLLFCRNKLQSLDYMAQRTDWSPAERDALDFARRETKYLINLSAGKQALAQGDIVTARRELEAANAHCKTRKVSWALFWLGIAPKPFQYVQQWRERYFLKSR